MVMARKPIKKPGFPDNIIGYTLWIKGTEWKKWIIMKIKEKKKTKYVAQKEYNLATIEERRNFFVFCHTNWYFHCFEFHDLKIWKS